MCFKRPRFEAIPCYYDYDDPEASFDMPLEVKLHSLRKTEGNNWQ